MLKAREKLWKSKQLEIVANYNVAFKTKLYECTDVSQQEALAKYTYGLNTETSLYERERNLKTVDEAMCLARAFDVARYG